MALPDSALPGGRLAASGASAPGNTEPDMSAVGVNRSLVERMFKLREHGTSVRTELVAGLTTFLTMAYIVFVNPAILGDAGMPREAVFVATCLIAALGTMNNASSRDLSKLL